MGIQSIVLSLIALVNLALNTMSLPCLRRGERRRCLLVFSRYESYRPCLCTYLSLPLHGKRKCFSTSKDSSKDRRSLLLTTAVRFLFSYYFHTFLVIERSNSRELRKQSNKKDLRINIEIFRRGRIRRRR